MRKAHGQKSTDRGYPLQATAKSGARLWRENEACSWQKFGVCSAHLTRVSPPLNAAQD
jgi:hypothetical protein